MARTSSAGIAPRRSTSPRLARPAAATRSAWARGSKAISSSLIWRRWPRLPLESRGSSPRKMFLRLVGESFSRKPRRKALTAAALALGMAVTTATLSVALDVGDRLAREFRSLGANLLVTPQADTLPLEIGGVDYRPVDAGAYLPESTLGKLKTIFWRNNIVGFAPLLEVPVFVSRFDVPTQDIPKLKPDASFIGTWSAHAVAVPDGSSYVTGIEETDPWWQIEGNWFNEGARECVVGRN